MSARLTDDHRAAVLHPLGPTEVEEPVSERRPDSAPGVWPAFRPVEAGAVEAAAPRSRSKEVDPELREKPGAICRDFSGFVAEHDVFARRERVGQIDTEPTGKVVIANPDQLNSFCWPRRGWERSLLAW